MNPGQELDKIIAEKVMGWKYTSLTFSLVPPDTINYVPIPKYSTDISAAWTVVEKMNSKKFDFFIEVVKEGIVARFRARFASNYTSDKSHLSDAPPHAICLAALKAIGVEL